LLRPVPFEPILSHVHSMFSRVRPARPLGKLFSRQTRRRLRASQH
jgi:hypothetical protein